MQLTAKGQSSEPSFRANTPSFRAEAMTEIMLKTFEAELDALLDLVGQDRRAATSEAMIRRYSTAEEVFAVLEGDYRRIQLKMLMLSDTLTEGLVRSEKDK